MCYSASWKTPARRLTCASVNGPIRMKISPRRRCDRLTGGDTQGYLPIADPHGASPLGSGRMSAELTPLEVAKILAGVVTVTGVMVMLGWSVLHSVRLGIEQLTVSTREIQYTTNGAGLATEHGTKTAGSASAVVAQKQATPSTNLIQQIGDAARKSAQSSASSDQQATGPRAVGPSHAGICGY